MHLLERHSKRVTVNGPSKSVRGSVQHERGVRENVFPTSLSRIHDSPRGRHLFVRADGATASGMSLEATLRRALDGDASATRDLVRALAPIVHARVVRGLYRKRQKSRDGRDPRQEIEDMTQEVFAALFASRGHVLRSWQPSRGLSLENFVGLVAERQVASILRTGRRSPWTEDPTDDELLVDAAGEDREAEGLVLSRDHVAALLDRLREELSPRGLRLFELLVVEERPIAEIVADTGMSEQALYAWRSRLLRQARSLATELQAVPPSERGTSLETKAVS